MITRLTLRNFKSIGEQSFEFTPFDLLVGRNNSGKSSVLQAIAIWQFCVDEFYRSNRTGKSGVQIVLPNFTALPLPEFILLWKDQTDRKYPALDDRKKKQEFILVQIELQWKDDSGTLRQFGVDLRYHSKQTMYAIPHEGWAVFRELQSSKAFPRIAYVPPFSGLEPEERYQDIAPMRQQIGKGQPGSILRNLLLRVAAPIDRDGLSNPFLRQPGENDWNEISTRIDRWFSVDLSKPVYEASKDVHITVSYRQGAKSYDIIAGGSGFHQTLTLLAFLYGWRPTTILLDEPDAHVHVNLQRQILDYFQEKSQMLGTQFLVATHAEEFVRGVDPSQIISLLDGVPKRMKATTPLINAMAQVANEEVTRTLASPFVIYVEGETDERILRAWAVACDAKDTLADVTFKVMGGGSKQTMKINADVHFEALKQYAPSVQRIVLFDRDSDETAFHPATDNPVLCEWRRKNIENYLLVPDAWCRASEQALNSGPTNLFMEPLKSVIDDFFRDQNLTLPPGRSWQTVTADIFSAVDGKKILFESESSLYRELIATDPSLSLSRESVARAMTAEEVHEDVHHFFGKVKSMVNSS